MLVDVHSELMTSRGAQPLRPSTWVSQVLRVYPPSVVQTSTNIYQRARSRGRIPNQVTSGQDSRVLVPPFELGRVGSCTTRSHRVRVGHEVLVSRHGPVATRSRPSEGQGCLRSWFSEQDAETLLSMCVCQGNDQLRVAKAFAGSACYMDKQLTHTSLCCIILQNLTIFKGLY